MRFAATALCISLLSLPAIAEDADPAVVAKVNAAAAKGYAKPADAEVRNVRPSKAKNGTGYCGEISVEGAEGTFSVFHVLLETPNGPSVLRQSDYPNPDTDPQAATVLLLLGNFGCLD